MRRGNVLVANALGSNLLESSTLLGYLPNLSQKLLGEPLKMPSVATWWCGEPAALNEVIANVHRLVIKGAFPQQRVEPMFGEDLDERGKKRVVGMLRARPVMLELLRRAGILPAGGPAPGDKDLSAALRAAITDDARPGLAANLRQLGSAAIPSWSEIGRDTVAVYGRAIDGWRADATVSSVRPTPRRA